MSKNKDNEFDFEWDDESSFDSSLDNFDGDVDSYAGEEIKDAKKDRSPVVEKLKSVTPTISTAGRAFTAGAGKGIGKAIENDMPSVYQAYQQGTHILSEARIARQEINDKFKPWWNDTKRAIRRLSQQLEGQMPFGLDKKILKLVGEEDNDQQYKQPSKEALRQEQMDSNINQIFELQMQKSMEQQKDTVLNRAYDRRVDAIRHKESAGFLSKIAESAVYQQAFTSSVFTAYLKKDLELKYKQFYATEDILGVMTNHAKAVDLKLEAVIKNTALPEADKVYMSERFANAAKEKLANSFSDKVSNYFSKMRENFVSKVKDGLDFAELIPELLNSQSDILEMMNDEDMKEFGGGGLDQDSIFTKRGMMGLIFGKAGGSFAQRMFRKLTSKLPQETMASIENYFGGGWNGLALLSDDIARGRIKGVPSGIRELIRAVAPKLRDTTQTVLNEGWQNRDAGGKITNRFIQVVQDVIPGYLKMQTRYLEILATGKDSGLLEWDYKKHTFRSQKEMYDEANKSILVDKEYANLRVQKGASDTRNLIAHVTAGYREYGVAERESMTKALAANTKDIELFKINLAHSEEYYRITGDILKDLEAIATGENIDVIQENELYKIAFKGIQNPIPVAGFWLDLLSDRTRTNEIVPNQIAIDGLNRYLTEERMNNSGRFARMLESHIKEGRYFMANAFGAKQDSSGDWNIDEAALLRQQLGAANSKGAQFRKAITDPEKLKAFNELFGQIQYEEKNKKNWLRSFAKGLKEKISKFNMADFADDNLKGGFISIYKKLFGSGADDKNAERDAENAWKAVMSSIEEARKVGHEIYDSVTGAVKEAWDSAKVKTVEEALSFLGDKVDKSFNELLRKLKYKEDGETKLKSISDLTEDDWFDWFASIDNIDTVLNTFGGDSAASHIMRSILPDRVQVLLLAVRDRPEVFKKMRNERQESSGTDTASVTRRTAQIRKLANDAISKKKKDMEKNRHSSLWQSGKNHGKLDKAVYEDLVRTNKVDYDDEHAKLLLGEKKLTDPTVDINKTQLDILKNIDIQLGDFYRAFIDVDFRNKALSELRKSEGKLSGDHENWYKGQDESVSTAYGKQIAHWTSMLNDPTMKQWHQLATTQLQMLTSGQYDEQYQGRESYEKYSNRNKDAQIEKVRENAVYGIESGFGVGGVELRSGAVFRSDAELLAEFNRLQTISKSKLTWTEFRNEQRALDRRKYYIIKLEEHLKKINDKNSIQAVLISWIIDNNAWLLKNASNYIPDVVLFEIIRNTLIYAMEADSISLKKAERNLSLVLVRSPQSTGSRSEDLIIGYIQEFLPLYSKDILTSAAEATTSDYARMKNLAKLDVMGSAIEGTGLTGNRNLTKAYGDMYNEAYNKISYAEDGDDSYSSSPEYVNDLLLYHTADTGLKGVRYASDNSRMGRLAKASEDTTKRDLYREYARVKNLKQNALEYGNINYKVAAGLDKREADARYGIFKQMHGPIGKAARRQMWQAMNGNKRRKKHALGGSYNNLLIDQYGGYVDQPTNILGGYGIAGEAGGETIIPHKFNERFKELIYRCLRDTVGENVARRVLSMLRPSETTEDKLGILLSDNDKVKFAKGGSTAVADTAQQDTLPVSGNKDEYTRKYPIDSQRNILLNILESNEAIYRKIGDGLLVVDLASALNKLKDSELIKKLQGLGIGERIKNIISTAYGKGKSIGGTVLDYGRFIVRKSIGNVASFGRHLILGNKACDVFLKSDIEGQVHGDKKISAAEIENGTIFSDEKCTKPIYSVADIYPPVYRKTTDENGNTVVEEAITKEEAKRGLVDEQGNPLTYFGGKVGRFLHNIFMKPINAIFSKSALEKISNIGSSITAGIRHGFAGLFGAYCDVYSARDPEKMLVSGTSIKEGRLVRIPKEGDKPKVVPTVFDIDGECWIMVDDPDNPGQRKLGNQVIYDEDITAGLQHKDGTPIESSKISLAMSKLRRLAGTLGGAALSLTGGALRLSGTVISGLWKAGGWLWKHGKEAVVKAFTAKNKYIDVCVIRNNEKKIVMHADELKDNKATKRYCYIDKDGEYTPVLSAYGISAPVYDMRGSKVGDTDEYDGIPVQIISQDDVDKQAIFDNNGNKLTEWAGRSLVGKIGFGAIGVVKFGWDKLKKIGKGIWKIGKAAVGAIGSILGEGGAAVTSIITNAWNSTIDLFKNTVVSRKDLQEIVGDRLLDIYGLLYKYMPRRKYDPNDKDGDGDVDGSWEDYEQKRKERESKREQARLEQWYKDHPNPHMGDNKEGFLSRLKGLLGFGGDKDDDDGSIGDYLLDLFMLKEAGSWVGGKFKKAGKGIGKLFGKLFGRKGAAAAAAVSTATKAAKEPGILSKAWGSIKGLFGNRAANAAAEKELAGLRAKIAAHHASFMGKAAAGTAGKAAAKTAAKTVGKGLLGRLATMFGTRIAAQAAVATSANAAPVVGQIASAALWALTGIEIAYLLSKDSPKTKNMRAIRSKGYGLNSKYWEAMIDLETDTFDEWVNGNQSGVDRDRLRKFGYKVDFMSLSGDDSSKVDYLSAWYRQRFTPMYQFYLSCMRSVGAEFESSPPKDDAIPEDRYALFVNEFTKHVDKFCNGPVRILRLDKSSYTSWLTKRRALEQEEGLSSSKYNDANLRDTSVSSMADKYVGKASDHFAYAWNELWHGNVLNAITSVYKGSAAVYANAITKLVDIAFANVQGIVDHFVEGITGVKRTSKHEKAWDKLRLELYGLSEGGVRKDEYNRITNIIKEFEIHQVHVIDGEQEVLDEELEELADKLFPARVRSDIKNRLSLTSGFNDDTSKDLHAEAKSFTISWYKRIFVPIFTAYAQVVRTACGDGPGDNINIDDIPEENRLPLLKDFERQSKQFLSRNIDTEILRMSSDGLYTYLIRRSEEDKAELAKDANGLMTEEDLGFTDKLSKNLNQSGKDFSEAWDALKHNFNVTRAISKTIHGIGTGLAGIFKTVGTSIGESISDFLHGSSNKHKWETRFYDYGFVSTEGSSDAFASITNNNISAMVQFENEAGRLLLEDNTSKPADEYFISIMLNTGYLDKCCKSLFGANGTDSTLEKLNSIKRTLSFTSSNYMLFAGPIAGAAKGISSFVNLLGTNNEVNSLAALKKYITDKLTSEISESKDKGGKVNNIKQKISDMFNYIDFWYTFRFKPIFSVFVNAVSPYGVDMSDIDVDDIPNENRKEAYEEYKKLVGAALKKDNIQRWNLSPEGLAVYLEEINKYREDMKDGTLDDKTNPLAAYYKEKEDEYAREVVDTAIASMHGVSAEDKKHVVESLSKASVEIDNELNDVSFMASLSASDALKDLGVQDIFNNKNKVEVTAFGKLMELTTGYNNYDKKGVNSGIFFDDKLGEVFTDFTEDAHEYLYQGASGEDLHDALTKFMNIYLESKVFLQGQTQAVQILDTIMARKYPGVAADNATYKYFANWFAHRFIPYYTYFVTLVNKANKVDNKEEPDLGKLTPMTRRYVILKLMTAEKKNLIPSRAQALKLTQDDMDKFYKREQALKDATSPGGSTQRAARSKLLKDLEDSNKALAEKIATERNKTIADSLNNTTDSSSLSTVKAMAGVSAGAKVGDRFVKQKGRSLTEKERREVWDFLVGRMGLTETQAAAVMGNMMQESGLSCDVVNGIGATGICQWLGSRLYGGDGYIGLIPFAKAKGLDPNSLQAQLEYFEWEVTHNNYERKRFDDYVRNVTENPNNIDKTIAECAVGFRKGFERCGEHEARDSRRVAYSKAFYNKFSSDKDIPKYADPYDSNVESMLSNLSVEETSLPPHIKQYGDNTITSTISSDETTGVSGGNSSLPSHIARYGNISAITTKACKSITANSREKSIGKCAKYVADALKSAGYKFNRQPSAYMYHTNGVLSGMGFECIGRTNSQPQAGDICVINRFNGHPHGHICMFNGQQWVSDFRQRTPVPYKVGAPGGLWYYRPSDNTSAGNSGGFITNNESASSSQDSVVNSAYNSIKTNDALLYSNAVDTIRNSLPEESTEQTPVYTYANMTGEGNNENIRTQNAIQNSITTANNGSAPIVAELQLISSILAGFRGDVNNFINTLLQGIPTQGSKGSTSSTTNKKGELVNNNIDEKVIKDMGDKLLAYVTSALSTVMNSNIPNAVSNIPRILASAYPLNSSKRG